jgi:uncharacterized membrane protein YhaH (DUF805 family)
MARTVRGSENYLTQVLKHIPSEIVMAYVTVDGVLQSSYKASVPQERQTLMTLLWILLGVLTVLTPFWLWRVMGVRRLRQLCLSTLSVPVWLFALGGPFALQEWYRPALGAVVLPLYTLVVPCITSQSPRS